MKLAYLQDQLDLSAREPSRLDPDGRLGRINTIFISGPGDSADTSEVAAALRASLRLEDYGLKLQPSRDGRRVSVETRSMILPAPLQQAAETAADAAGHTALPVLTYLVNEIRPAAGKGNVKNDIEEDSDEAVPHAAYSVAAGLDLAAADFTFDGPAPSFPLADDAVLINRWLADDLGVAAGEAIEVDAFPAGSIGEVPAETLRFTVAGIVATEGDGAAASLTPTVPGITDADSFADWEQPFDMDLDRVTDRDEAYWDEYRAAPKLFLPLAAMQDRFATRYGRATSVRVQSDDPIDVAAFEAALLDAIDPASVGLVVQPVKAQQLAAASGTTDFSGLFLGFSFFLIAAALLLVGLLFRLAIERRASQLGLLGAVGFTPSQVRRLLLAEGTIVAAVGGLLGLAGGWAFAKLMLHGLTTWWSGAIGTADLQLHVERSSLLIGWGLSVAVAIGTMAWAVRTLHRQSVRSLLAGRTADPLDAAGTRSRRRWAKGVAIAAAGAAGLLLALSLVGVLGDAEAFTGFSWRVIGFFLVGTLLLVAAIAGLGATLDRRDQTTTDSLTAAGLSWRNASRARGRSLLTASLIASACFVLVAVAVAKRDPASELPDRQSGNGGYLLIAESTAPVLFDLNTAAGRDKAGFRGDWPDDITVAALARRPGDDASCLNLYRASLPTLLGVPDAVLDDWAAGSRFRFADTPEDSRWKRLLAERQPGDPIPVIGDLNTLQYSLHIGRGDRLPLPVAPGTGEQQPELEVVGMLDSSVFQGVLLMRESDLKAAFPEVVGSRTFLVEADADPAAALARRDAIGTRLEDGLSDSGWDAEPVAERIAAFLAVQNTYLATFQTLGGLGLLLGTIGLAAVMLRNIAERRGELSLMRAVGFRPGRLRSIVLRENLALLLWGLAAGCVAALLAMLPHLRSTGADVPWRSLLTLLAAVAVVGTLAALWAVRRAGRVGIVAGLRSE